MVAEKKMTGKKVRLHGSKLSGALIVRKVQYYFYFIILNYLANFQGVLLSFICWFALV